ncbi:MAG: hypothetical protein Q6363_002590 [Candidatus Njordarchaeota archaeon]
MARTRFKVKIPWIFKYKLNLYKPRYHIAVPDLGLEKRGNRELIFAMIIIVLSVLFGGIFMVVYEFTPPLIEISGQPALIYPGFSRETFTEFLLAVAIFLMSGIGAYLIRIAPRREEEAWETYMYFGLILLLLSAIVLAAVFAYKSGLLQVGRIRR